MCPMRYRSTLHAGFKLALIVSVIGFQPASADIVNDFPDPCTETPIEKVTSFQYEFPAAVPDTDRSEPNCVVHFPDQEVFDPDHPLVVLSHGNGFAFSSYERLLGHLAGNNFIAAACQRSVNLLDVVADLKTVFGLGDRAPVALLGHSRGGPAAVEAANENAGLGHPHRIEAVMGLAPAAPEDLHLPASSTPAYMALYGSIDQDTSGWGVGQPALSGADPNAAFVAYDRAGTEADTSGPFLFEPLMTRAMVYVYGADHNGPSDLGFGFGCNQEKDYLSSPIQECIVRAYVTGFLRWRLLGHQFYAGMIRGEWTPLSVLQAKTSEADGWNNPAGSKIRLFPQFSPRYRRVIANFESPAPIQASPSLILQEGDSHDLDLHSPHATRALQVVWFLEPATQFLQLTIPSAPDFLSGNKRNVSNLGFLSFRAGQIHEPPVDDILHLNPFNQDQNFQVFLTDEDGKSAGAWVSEFASIPYPDLHAMNQMGTCSRIGDFSKSAMRTVRIPIWRFRGIDLTRVKHVTFGFPRGTTGKMFFDNVEFTTE
jgi:pimeloyl-ACP methyl ester carboxylesterase